MESRTGNAFVLKSKVVDESFVNGMTQRPAFFGLIEPGRFTCMVLDQERQKVVLLKDFRLRSDVMGIPPTAIEELLDADEHLQDFVFEKAVISVCSPCAVIIPGPLFSADHAADALNLACYPEDESVVQFDAVQVIDAYQVYAVPRAFLESTGKRFKEFSLYHAQTAFMRSQLKQNKHQQEAVVSVNVRESRMDVVVTKGSDLLFTNSFSYESSEDFIYYLLLVLEQLNLNPDLTETRFFGEIDKTAANFMVCKKYIRNINLGERPEGITYSYGFEKLNPAQFYLLFSQFLCVS